MEIKTSSINLIVTGADGGKEVLMVGLKEAYRAKPQYQRYLRKEFERCSALDDTRLFRYTALKESPEMGLYIETEWEDSRSLADWLTEGHTDDEKKRVVRDVAAALGYMHSQGVVHGCLNSHNIFITKRGDAVRLLTVALRYADSMSQPLSTLKYLAPEAKDGTVGLDHRADIYSLGILLKDMGFAAEYHNVIERCCRFGRNERFAGVDEFVEAVDRRHYTRSSDELTNDSPALSSNKKMAVMLAVIVVLVGAAVAIFVAQGSNDDEAGQQQPVATQQSDTMQTEQQDMDSTVRTQPAVQAQGDADGAAWQGDNAYLNDLVPQMRADLDKIYNSGADNATVRRRVAAYYKGLRRVLKKQGKTLSQLDAFDNAFADYTKQKNQ